VVLLPWQFCLVRDSQETGQLSGHLKNSNGEGWIHKASFHWSMWWWTTQY
jgi:hypothetical protein